MLNIFLCAFWPTAFLLCRNVCLGLLPIFRSSCLLFVVEFYELFVYFGNQALVSCIVCKYFLPFGRLSFRFVYGFLCSAKDCKFDQVGIYSKTTVESQPMAATGRQAVTHIQKFVLAFSQQKQYSFPFSSLVEFKQHIESSSKFNIVTQQLQHICPSLPLRQENIS